MNIRLNRIHTLLEPHAAIKTQAASSAPSSYDMRNNQLEIAAYGGTEQGVVESNKQ